MAAAGFVLCGDGSVTSDGTPSMKQTNKLKRQIDVGKVGK